MDGCLHLQGCARRHGGGAWLGLPTLVHYSIATRIDCAARIKREIFRRTFLAGGFREILVAQTRCLCYERGLTWRRISGTVQNLMNKSVIGCGAVLVVLLFIVVVAALALGGSYNRLVRLQQTVDQSWAQVQNVYQRRADLIPNLVNTVAGAANFEKSTLVEVTNARASVGRVQLDPNKAPTDAAQLEQFQTAPAQLSSALSRLLVVVERYPELKANQNFLSLQAQLEGTENRISVERGSFNSAVQNYNTAVRSVPANFVAGMFRFSPRPVFASQPGAERPPPVQFNFGSPAPTPATTGSP